MLELINVTFCPFMETSAFKVGKSTIGRYTKVFKFVREGVSWKSKLKCP